MVKVKKCAGKEVFERINYLYQASNVMLAENEASNVASKMYSNLLVAVAKKSVQRIDIDFKRTLCKGCRCLLLSGVTCRVRIKKKKAKWTCLNCLTVKTFDLKRNYTPWFQTKNSIVEVLDYGQNID